VSPEETIAGLGHLVDGRIVNSGSTFPIESPKTGQPFAECPAASPELLDEAMRAAQAAQPGWAALGVAKRQDCLRRMRDVLQENMAEIVAISALERGARSAALEAYAALSFADHYISTTPTVDVLEDTDERTVQVVRKPVGVVAAISPWNAPILIGTEKAFSALLVGNTVVAKPSPFTSLATLRLAQLWADIVPPGVLNVLAGDDDLGAAMVSHPVTKLISFTGSVSAGQQIAAAAARDLKNIVLELGGNDAAIVLPDVDVPTVASRVFNVAFLGGGQVCAAIKRLYVHESIYDSMVAELAQLAEQAVAAPEEEGGKLIAVSTRPQYERVRMLVEDALEHGAKPVAGGAPTRTDGYYFPATILTNVSEGMRIVDEEQFGPVLPVLPFSDVDDAITAANSTDYGLCGSIWTSDIELGQKLADRLVAGTTWVNHHAEVAPHIPFGGVKHSGIGRNSGRAGLDAYCELQTQYVYKSPARVQAGSDARA
jgi:acyl-CoA reductase-like NAD-dependent aldehyde dehydrogenase